MPLVKERKKQIVQDLAKTFQGNPNVVFLGLSGFNVEGQSQLRKALKEVGGRLLVAKKTLLKLAWAKVFSRELRAELEEVLERPVPVAVSFASGLPEQLPKAVLEGIQQILGKKDVQEKVLGGLLGEEFLTAQVVKQLATLPGKEQLQAQLLQVLQGPLQQFLSVLRAPSQNLLYLLSLKAKS